MTLQATAVTATVSNENPNLCYQCGKCSTGCPVAQEMDMLPHQIIHALSLGQEAKALSSNTIWMCAGCFTCAVRCPNDIDITTVMDSLRQKAVAQGIPCPKPDVLKFHQTFLKDVGRRGRVHELRLVAEYNIKKGTPFHNASLGPQMFLKGRLHILPPKAVKNFKNWFKKLWK